MKDDPTIIIIGAGVAGLSAGIYAQMNGYKTSIHEMHSLPGGLCTAWKRKGFTLDGCIHWLVGSSPANGLYQYWQEVGIIQGREFINPEEYARYEGADGRTLVLYTNVDQLEQSLMACSPADATVIGEFIGGIRLCMDFDFPSATLPPVKRALAVIRLGLLFVTKGRALKRWMNTTAADFAGRFKDPMIRGALRDMWLPDFSMLFMLFTFAWLHKKCAGYPLGGSLPMAQAMAKRYLALGGTLHFNSRVQKILVEDNRAVGIRLTDGSEHRAARVVSAADGHETIFSLLEGRYADATTRLPYETWPTFPSLLHVGLGVNRSFDNEPKSVSGFSFALKQPTTIADAVLSRLPVHLYNQDPSLAPVGKTSVVVMLPSSYDYWKELSRDPAAYKAAKEAAAHAVIACLEQRFPGISGQIEMIDVATPLTFERYTGNWKGIFEGWLITPGNSGTLMNPMSQTLPGLSNFYQCGQWVEPGGGLPSGVMSARRLVKSLCKQDRQQFHALSA